jgi:hypothetical protein
MVSCRNEAGISISVQNSQVNQSKQVEENGCEKV